MERVSRILQLLQEYDNARKEYHRMLQSGGWRITGPQVGVLRVVTLFPGISVSELAEKMSVHITTAEGYINRLAGRGYLAVRGDPDDRRRKIISLTEAGLSVINEVPLGYKSLLARNLAGAGDAEKQIIIDGLEKLVQYLKEEPS